MTRNDGIQYKDALDQILLNGSIWNRIASAQPIDATHALKRSAGVSNPSVLRGRSFNRRAVDFMSDALADGCLLHTFNVIDDCDREGLVIEVDLSLPSQRVIRVLEQIIEWRGKSAPIRLDNAPEYIAQALVDWANARCITLMYIQPGKPTQNAYIERFNRTCDMNGWTCMSFTLSSTHSNSRPSGCGGTTMSDPIQQPAAYHPDNC